MAFTYFDFDNFKAFNDSYGFRQGDRAISSSPTCSGTKGG
jgi:GGDEF domain-containing protein